MVTLQHESADPQPDIALAESLFEFLRAATTDGDGVTRESYGPGENAAHVIVREAAELWAEDEHVSIQLRRALERLQSRELQATTMSDVKP